MIQIPRTIHLSVHDLPPGHAHQCAYVGRLPHSSFHIRLSLDKFSDRPRLVVQLFPRVQDPNPERPPRRRIVSQMFDTHHQIIIPLDTPRRPQTESHNRATLNTIKVQHATKLTEAAELGRQFQKREVLLALLNAFSLVPVDPPAFGDDYADIIRIGKRALSLWNPGS